MSLLVGWSHASEEEPGADDGALGACTALEDSEWGASRGRVAGERSRERLIRLWSRGRPDPLAHGAKARRWSAAGWRCQVSNEPNLRELGKPADVEEYPGDEHDHARWLGAVLDAAGPAHNVYLTPFSPFATESLRRWLAAHRGVARHCRGLVAHAYGNVDEMRRALAPVRELADELGLPVWIGEAAPRVDQDPAVWGHDHLPRFAERVALEAPQVEALTVFAPSWPRPDGLSGQPLRFLGTDVDRWLRSYVPPEPVLGPPQPPSDTSEPDPTPAEPAPKPPTEVPVQHVTLSVDHYWREAHPQNYSTEPLRPIGALLHSTGGGSSLPENEFSGTVNWFTNPESGVSAHAVVGAGRLSTVAFMVALYQQAYHGGHRTDRALSENPRRRGVELAHADSPQANLLGYTDFQYAATAELLARWLVEDRKRGFDWPLRFVDDDAAPGLRLHAETAAGTSYGKRDPTGPFDKARLEREAQAWYARITGAPVPAPRPPPPAARAASQGLLDALNGAWFETEKLAALEHRDRAVRIQRHIAALKDEIRKLGVAL